MRVRKWAQRHDRLLTVLGALLIFATFLVKDIYSEKAKTLEASIQSAKRDFDEADVTSAIFDLIDRVRFTVNSIELDIQKPKNVGPRPTAEARRGAIEGRLGEFRGHLNNMMRLEEKLPKGLDHGCSKDEMAKLEANLDAIANMLRDNDSHGAEERLPMAKVRIKQCEKKLITTSEAIRDNAERWSTFWTRFGYILFGIGWTLTLLGKLSKNEGIEVLEAG